MPLTQNTPIDGLTTDERIRQQKKQDEATATRIVAERQYGAESDRMASDIAVMFPWLANAPLTRGFIVEYDRKYQQWPSATEIKAFGAYVKESFSVPGLGGPGTGTNTVDELRSLHTAIYNESQRLGLNLSFESIDQIARTAQSQNYTSDQVSAALMNVVNWSSVQAGSLTATMDDVRSMANNYFVKLSDTTLQDYARRIATKQATKDGIESYLRASAKAANPWLASYIDAGLSPLEIMRSAGDQIAQSLGLNPAEVNFSDQRFMKLATVQDNGITRLATQSEIASNVRQDSAWAKSDEAMNQLTTLGGYLSKIFGKAIF